VDFFEADHTGTKEDLQKQGKRMLRHSICGFLLAYTLYFGLPENRQ